MNIQNFIKEALLEDIGDGDHTSLACIDKNQNQKAKLLVKEEGVLAGVKIALQIFKTFDSKLETKLFLEDGDSIKPGDIALEVSGPAISILSTERLVLNIMQRMSGIATQTHKLSKLIAHTNCKLLDTRKTTPLFRYLEKEAVRIGGGLNHRYALYDMILIKDNHIDYAGGVSNAISKAISYVKENNKNLKIEVEVRNEAELKEALTFKEVFRIMLDNHTPEQIKKSISIIKQSNPLVQTEASGGINESNLVAYAETGVDYISMGALTHHVRSLDLSLKAF